MKLDKHILIDGELEGEGEEGLQEKFNERILKEIIVLRKTAEVVGMNQRISNQLEILRYVRNSVLGISFDEGFIQENQRWRENN